MRFACVYCGKEVPDGCPSETTFSCCGEVGHVEMLDEEAPLDALMARPLKPNETEE